MELNLSLRSLEAAGRPSGTGRPSLPSSHENGRSRTDRDAPARRDAEESRAGQREDARSTPGRREEHHDDHVQAARARKPQKPEARPSTATEEAPFERELETQTRTAAASPSKGPAAPAKQGRSAEAQGDASPEPDASNVESPTSAPGAPSEERREATGDTPAPLPQKAIVPETESPVGMTADLEAEAATLESASTLEGDGRSIGVEPAPSDPAPSVTPRVLSAGLGTAATERGVSAEAITSRQPVTHAVSSQEPTANASPQHAPRADETRASEILRQVRVSITPELKHAVIHLNPAELGRISIQLTVEDEGLVARVRAEKHEAIDALERHLPELRAALSRQGIQTQHFDLALGFQDQRKPDDPRTGRSPEARGRAMGGTGSESDEPLQHVRRVLSEGAIDTYA